MFVVEGCFLRELYSRGHVGQDKNWFDLVHLLCAKPMRILGIVDRRMIL